MEVGNNGEITVAQSHNGITLISPLSYHLLDHEYGQTPQHQIIRRPTAAPPRTEVCSNIMDMRLESTLLLLFHVYSMCVYDHL
jgi:hypothetical protein